MPAHHDNTPHEPGANLTATVTNYGEAGKLVVPAGSMIDCIEIKVKGGMPIHPDFAAATGDQNDMRRSRTLNYRRRSGRIVNCEMARWYDATTTDAADIVTPTAATTGAGSYFSTRWSQYFRWGNERMVAQPVITLVKGSGIFSGSTYRIWDAYRGIAGHPDNGPDDMYPGSNKIQLIYWADNQYETDFLRKRTLEYDVRGESYHIAKWSRYLHPRAIGMNYLSTRYNSATPKIVNFDLSPIKPGKRFVIQQEFEF
jgi:hypothetical protein